MDFKEKIMKDTLDVSKKLEQVKQQLNDAANNNDIGISSFSSILCDCIKNVSDAYRKLVRIKGELGQGNSYELIPNEKHMQIYHEKQIYHFILEERLPHRVTIDQYNNQLKYDYDRNIFYSGYRAVVERYLNEHVPEKFKRKAVLYVKTHGHASRLTDNDNMELKTFIDAVIKGIFVKDDSPEYLSLYIDSVADGKDFTEMYLGYPEDIMPLALIDCNS